MIKNTDQLMNESLVIAQSKTPIETGNLMFNSYRAYKTPTGFRITSLFTVAFYGGILDVSKKTKQFQWWSKGVYLTVGAYIKASSDDKKNNFQQANRLIGKFAVGDTDRLERFYNSMVADDGRDKFIAGV